MDWCTLWFEGWWACCCRAHDLGYSGTLDRAAADLELLLCVLKSGPWWLAPASACVGLSMYLAVRIFGWYFYNK